MIRSNKPADIRLTRRATEWRLHNIGPEQIFLVTQMDHHSPQSERSDLSGRYTEGGITVVVEIFPPSGGDHWRMEVTSLEEQLTDWNEPFASPHEAWEEFIFVVNTAGLAAFLQA
ncbi:hypothetical protein [Neorhizobium sp. NCHU2750]|uniref:hypothetical protein n=1 Tax=Neorhizobium sp. NCHU2750 TaxID=1825976 RepID=UPI0013C52A44